MTWRKPLIKTSFATFQRATTSYLTIYLQSTVSFLEPALKLIDDDDINSVYSVAYQKA